MMDGGWVEVKIAPFAKSGVVRWKVRVGDASGKLGERIATAAGANRVVVEAEVTFPLAWAVARLHFTMHVRPHSITRIRLLPSRWAHLLPRAV